MKIKLKSYNYITAKFHLGQTVRHKYSLSLFTVEAMLNLNSNPPIIQYGPNTNNEIMDLINFILDMHENDEFENEDIKKWIYIVKDVDCIADYFEDGLEPV